MANNNQLQTEHIQRLVRALFADRLRQEGFVSYKNQDVAWYRLVNQEVLQTIYFYTIDSFIPVFMNIGVGCHPLYVEPKFTASVRYSKDRNNEVRFQEKLFVDFPLKSYSSDILVMCPAEEQKRMAIFENILKELEPIHSAWEAYQAHKAMYSKRRTFRSISTDFINEMIFYQDVEMYEKTLPDIEFLLKESQELSDMRSYAERGKILEIQIQAIRSGNYDEVLAMIQQKRERVVRALKRNFGIEV